MAISKDTILNVIGKVTQDYELYEHKEQLTVALPKDKLLEVCKALRDDASTLFDSLVDITAIDWARKNNRYDVIYFLYSIKLKGRVRLRIKLEENDLHVPTIVSIWESANWYERETYDMYGIIFDNHPDFRRFYMPEDFADPETGEQLYPLRKDFPLMGIPGSLPLPPYPEKFGEIIEN